MKNRIGRASLAAAACCTMWLCLTTAVCASPAPSDSVGYCALLDPDAWRREHPVPAGKQAAEKNVGEPRTVRMIYFVPNDREFRQSVTDSMKRVIVEAQTFFALQMASHGYGPMTFRYETDADGEPVVHHMVGEHGDAYYRNSMSVPVQRQLFPAFETLNRVYLIVIDHSTGMIPLGDGTMVIGVAAGSREDGRAMVRVGFRFGLVAHELAHAFGLQAHDFRDTSYILSYGRGQNRLSACSAGHLAVSPYFNRELSLERDWDSDPAVEYLGGSRWYPAGTSSVTLPWRVADPDGLHMVFLNVGRPGGGSLAGEVKACRMLSGQTEAVVAFEYDGVIPSLPNSGFSDPTTHVYYALAYDGRGYHTSNNSAIAQASPHHVATIESQADVLIDMAISPERGLLAAGSVDGRVQVWDVETWEEMAMLDEPEEAVASVAFSPDGGLLAAGEYPGRIGLSEVEPWREIAVLEGHTGYVHEVAFSPDGKLLASASHDSTVRVWDVAARREIAVLDAHRNSVYSVAFSPDGGILASASYDSTVKLWDVDAWEETATLEGRHRFRTLAFSPDGSLLASGERFNGVRLWDVASRRQVAGVKAAVPYVLAFSPEGGILAVQRNFSNVFLWDVVSEEILEAYAQPVGSVRSAAFLPGGDILAVMHTKGIELWDVSPHTGPESRVPDWDGDGQVGLGDFVKFIAKFGYSRGQAGYDPRFDLDGDGTVGFSDFVIFAGAFGQTS